jgi:nucleoside-diphosphate-sugar epimerase
LTAGRRVANGGASRLALVTGASGFVGGHLVEALLGDGWRVRALVRSSSRLRWIPADRVDLVIGGLDDPAALAGALAGVSVVFHLAAVTTAIDPAQYTRVNVDGTRQLLDAMRGAAPRALLVYCSSQAAAGPSRTGRPMTESDEAAPIGPYGVSKLAAERLLANSDCRHVVIRPPAVYGPRDVDILTAFKLARAGLAFRLGPTGQRLALVHVRDLARGLIAAATAAHARGVYYVSGDTVPWESLIASIGTAVARRPRVIPVPSFVPVAAGVAERTLARITGAKVLLTAERVLNLRQPDWSCDDTRARRELGYAPAIDLATGFAETAAWYREQGWLS